MDGRPNVKRRKHPVELSQSLIGQAAHRPQRMLCQDPGLEVDIIGEQRPARSSPASTRRDSLATSGNHAKRINTNAPSAGFFSTLLESKFFRLIWHHVNPDR
jgi:hypothetical protein